MFDYTIIIAAPVYDPQWPVLTSLRDCYFTPGSIEVLLAIGHQPSRQRNAAIARAQGKVILFLDSDCVVTDAYFKRLRTQLPELNADVLGGPVLLQEPASPTQIIFQAVLSHALAVGPTASRYTSAGDPRECNESELILCNLAVRADVFKKQPAFNESLYPNEENEWLDRIASQAKLWHDPHLILHRPQRASWREFFSSMLRYGTGRGRQTVLSGKASIKVLPSALLVLWVFLSLIAYTATSVLTFLGVVAYTALIATTCHFTAARSHSFTWVDRVKVSLGAIGAIFFYAMGQLLGFAGWPPPSPRAEEEIQIVVEPIA